MPSFERTDLDANSFRLKIVLHPSDIQPDFEKELKSYQKDATLKGFRKGKAPLGYVKSLVGQDLYGRMLYNKVGDTLEAYIKENTIRIIGQPIPSADVEMDVEADYKKANRDQVFYYDVGFVEAFEVASLDGSIQLEKPVLTDTDKLAEEDLENIRKRSGKQTNPTEGIEENDMLTIRAVEVDEDNVPVDGGWETNITVLVNTIKNEELKKDLLGSAVDDVFFFNARSVEEFKSEDMFRKYFLNIPADDDRTVKDTFRGEITKISRIEKADLDGDFFAKNFGEEVEGKEAAMEKLKEGIVSYYDAQMTTLLRREVREELLKRNPIALPEKHLKNWVKITRPSPALADLDEVEDLLFEDVRWSLIREKLDAQFDLFATEEELHQAAYNQVIGYFQGQQMEDSFVMMLAERILADKNMRTDLEQQIETQKLYDEILKKVSIVEKPMTSEELHKHMDEVSAKAKAWNERYDKLSAILSDGKED